MIKKLTALSMSESLEYLDQEKESEEIEKFIKKFVKVKKEQGKEIRKKILELDILKIKEEDISKIIDIMSEDENDLNKIFIDNTLDSEEAKRVLDVLKEFKKNE